MLCLNNVCIYENNISFTINFFFKKLRCFFTTKINILQYKYFFYNLKLKIMFGEDEELKSETSGTNVRHERS